MVEENNLSDLVERAERVAKKEERLIWTKRLLELIEELGDRRG